MVGVSRGSSGRTRQIQGNGYKETLKSKVRWGRGRWESFRIMACACLRAEL